MWCRRRWSSLILLPGMCLPIIRCTKTWSASITSPHLINSSCDLYYESIISMKGIGKAPKKGVKLTIHNANIIITCNNNCSVFCRLHSTTASALLPQPWSQFLSCSPAFLSAPSPVLTFCCSPPTYWRFCGKPPRYVPQSWHLSRCTQSPCAAIKTIRSRSSLPLSSLPGRTCCQPGAPESQAGRSSWSHRTSSEWRLGRTADPRYQTRS